MAHLLKSLNPDHFLEIYQIMEASFAAVEIRRYDQALQLLDDPNYHVYGIQNDRNDDWNFDGFIAEWTFQELRFIEHFALRPVRRGDGMGTKMLREYLDREKKPVFLEVEAGEEQNAKRRIEFYRRLGFFLTEFGYPQPALQDSDEEINLNIMTYPTPITAAEFLIFKKRIFERVYKSA